MMPLKMVSMGMPLATPARANTTTPTGGVIWPISMIMTDTTPNQTGSKPRATTVGKMEGRVSMSMGMTFIMQPRIT